MKKLILKKKFKEKSKKWLRRQITDIYYIRSKKEGFRSRSSYKLIELNNRFKFLLKKTKVLDLGAAPGGWAQVARKKCSEGKIMGIDLLNIKELEGVYFLECDLQKNDVISSVEDYFQGKVDVLLSDMAPNTIGHTKADHLRIINLVEVAIEISNKVLKKEGIFVCKIFQGGAQGELQQKMKKNFYNLKYFKPKSSRPESSEAYLVAKKI